MKLLIVDDDEDARHMLKLTFEHEAFEVDTAQDGLDALEKMDQSAPEIIITDALMPRMDGFVFCRHCKADPRYKDIPVLFLTAAYNEEKDQELGKNLGVARYLTKPLPPEDLVRIVREVLSERVREMLSKRDEPLGGKAGVAALSEEEYQRLHDEAVSRKLEEKIAELENANRTMERDAAERMLTEGALRNSEARFRTLTMKAPVGIFETDVRGHYTYVNQRWCELANCPPSDLLGQWWAAAVLPADQERIIVSWPNAAAIDSPWTMDFRFRNKAGAMTWVNGTIVAIHDEAGTLTGYLGTGLDITARKKIEEELQHSEMRFRTLVNSMDDVVFTLDQQHRHTGVYGGWILKKGFKPEDFLGKIARDMMGDAAAVHEQANDRALAGAVVDYEWSVTEGESRHFYHTVLSPIRDANNAVIGLVGIGRDITERKKFEQSLAASEKKLRDITDNVGEGIYVLDVEGKITFMNPEAERLLGWSITEMNKFGAHALIHHQRPDGSDLAYEDCRMHNVALTGEAYVSMDEVFVRKDGTVFPLAVITTPIREQGNIVASVTAFRDISDRKRIETDREKLIDELHKSLTQVKMLSGLLPICASCKKIRDDKGYWTQIESYISEHSEAEFSHGLCPDCTEKYYKKYGIKRQ